MKTLDEKIEDFLLIVMGFSTDELVEDFKSIVNDIANPKL
jgi:hypothetical protein